MSRRRWWLAAALAPLMAVVGWAGFAPIHPDSREELFEIPHGTYARRRAGDLVDILPSSITLTLDVNDVLLLRNLDEVPQQFGPTILMPGQSFRLPFEVASENRFDCTAHSSGQFVVIVEEKPVWPWQKIRWRLRHWLKS
ncbi:MAG TPA: hypothetical protein VFP37_01960 [Steroidobacteraceae bacterium]|nr:hypothetical protein [Steroidobacteraceae bacterium]